MKTPSRVTTPVLVLAVILLALHDVSGEQEPARTGDGSTIWKVFARLDKGPGNVTVTPMGRVLVSMHQFFEPDMRVAEVKPDGSIVPFPNSTWAVGGRADRLSLDTVLGIQSDARGVVWMLDNGMRGGSTPKIVGWDTRIDRLWRLYYLPPPLTVPGSFVNDLAVDVTNEFIYIADPAEGHNAALIVVNLRTGEARRILEGHESVIPEDIDLVIDDQPVAILGEDGELIRPRVGVNPIALDHADRWLYFGPMHGTSMYRIRTADLRNFNLSHSELADRVERYADKPICDGISIDRAGNIYISDLESNAVGVIRSDTRSYEILLEDDVRLSWPDAFSYGPGEWMYVVSNQLHRTAVLNAGQDETSPPFLILRFRPLAAGVVGR